MNKILKVKENIAVRNPLRDSSFELKSDQASILYEMFRDEAKQNGYLKFMPKDNKRDFYLVASDEDKHLAPDDLQVYTIDEFEKACNSYWKSD